tara:strand:+ start:1010 stop:1393 length:384 start_codon:yes stop_codon:yes gene_type:complete
MKFANRTTIKDAIAPGASVTSKSITGYSSSTLSSRRNTKQRRFAGAIACIKSGAQGTYTIKLVFVSGKGVEYQLDEVILTAGESATWSDEEYGLDLDSGDTVKLEFSGANTTSTDRVYLILKQKDYV